MNQVEESKIIIETGIPIPSLSKECNTAKDIEEQMPLGGSCLVIGLHPKKLHINLKRFGDLVGKVFSVRKEVGGVDGQYRVFRTK